ncbi:MAG: hypothetical protein ABIO71_05600 [Caldimonas sp.]
MASGAITGRDAGRAAAAGDARRLACPPRRLQCHRRRAPARTSASAQQVTTGPAADALLDLLRRFQEERVDYVLVGGHAVRLNGFTRTTEDIDVLLPSSIDNGRRVIRSLAHLKSSSELRPEWFETSVDAPENIRVADDLLIDLLFAANGETYDSLQANVRSITIQGVEVRTLDIAGLLKTKTDYRPKDRIDREVLLRLQQQLDRSS